MILTDPSENQPVYISLKPVILWIPINSELLSSMGATFLVIWLDIHKKDYINKFFEIKVIKMQRLVPVEVGPVINDSAPSILMF